MNFSPAEQRLFGLRDGDILATEGSGSLGAVGASAVWRGEIDGAVCFQNTLLRLRPREGVDSRFLAWWCRHAFADGVFASVATGANIYHVSAERVRALPVAYVPLGQQQDIADYLDTETARIDALIAKKQLLHASLLDRRAAVTYSAVRGDQTATGREFKDSGIPWLPAAPEHWRAAPLSLVAQHGSGHTPSRERPDWWLDCEIPWITTGEVTQMRSDRIEYISETRERISEVGLANSAAELHPASTVVLSRTASAGFSAIMGADMATSQDFVTWTCGPLLEPRFLLLCLRAMRTDLLERLAQGSTHKTIYMPDIKSIRIPLPPLEEQRQIVTRTWDEIRRIDDVVDRLDSQVQLLREHRQALITAAVTGELDVPARSA